MLLSKIQVSVLHIFIKAELHKRNNLNTKVKLLAHKKVQTC